MHALHCASSNIAKSAVNGSTRSIDEVLAYNSNSGGVKKAFVGEEHVAQTLKKTNQACHRRQLSIGSDAEHFSI